MVFSLLYSDVFLSISWALDLEIGRASSGNEFFKELLLGGKMKLRIGIGGAKVRVFFVFLLRCISWCPKISGQKEMG